MRTQNLFHDDLVVGIPSIDAEHRQLIGDLNRLIRDPSDAVASEPFSDHITRIGQRIIEHFQHEEAILRTCGLHPDDVEVHIKAHNQIVEQFTQLQFGLMSGAAVDSSATLEMVRSWIVTHLLSYDLQMKPYAAHGSI